MPKSLNLISTSRDIACKDSSECCATRSSGSSSKDNGGNAVFISGSNRIACFSFSTRSLLTIFCTTGSMRGGTRDSARLRSIFSASERCCLLTLASLAVSRLSNNSSNRCRMRATSASVISPTQSITTNQLKPLKSVKPADSTATNTKVAPTGLNIATRPGAISLPTMPPAPSVSPRPKSIKCSVPRPQLLSSVSAKPAQRRKKSGVLR